MTNEELENATFCCPGQSVPVDRATHLARLAQFYPECRDCPRRDDQAGISPRIAAAWRQVPPKTPLPQLLHYEGLAADLFHQFSPVEAAQIAAAFTRSFSNPIAAPLLLAVAHSAAIDQAEAMVNVWRRAGFDVELATDPTCAEVAWTIDQRKLDGGILLSTPSGDLRQIELTMFGPGGTPFASEELARLERQLQTPKPLSPAHRQGTLAEIDMSSPHLERFAPYHRARRPLRLVVQSPSRGSLRQLQQLIARSNCELFVLPSGGDWSVRLAAAIRQHRGHFGVWIDGSGESIEVFEERGYRVLQPRLSKLLIEEAVAWENAPLRVASPPPLEVPHDAVHFPTAAGRGAMFAAIRQYDCQLGIEPSGRYWWRNQLPTSDALGVVTLLLTRLSRDDRSLSSQLI
ncbi:hypothetical protein LOC68_20340 [Blastopirellula sp. JC732]|uniref:Uncharacterized protein n=1 Tax=Blastopirellula sediminis TaxID=2894196 RepID=A0A9X1MQ86_9BACT|nr:hypothetical protein [Blastopirellula sediminis]MCC9605950.1 hypothetical protein [Blastopirellula sediminis]MCC9630751.1 hypothetical protein [Blastopirellula sediminis]